MIKSFARWLLGQTIVGMIDYYRHREYGVAWGGPFNGQPARQPLFRDIIINVRPRAIVETGTYLGTTTDFMAGTDVPIYTIEADPRNYGFARARFWRRRNISLVLGDSRKALRRLFDGPLRALADSCLFFYLDAHWSEDLPLAEEIDIIFSRCPRAVVMIDDFQVPSDDGYRYDDYGSGKALTPRYIAPVVSAHELRPFYPATSSADEGGERRGCVVLAKHPAHMATLTSLALLRSIESTASAAV